MITLHRPGILMHDSECRCVDPRSLDQLTDTSHHGLETLNSGLLLIQLADEFSDSVVMSANSLNQVFQVRDVVFGLCASVALGLSVEFALAGALRWCHASWLLARVSFASG